MRMKVLLYSILLFSLVSRAEELTLREPANERKDNLTQGWNYRAKIMSGVGLDSSHSVVGQEDGDTVKLDLNLDVGATFIKDSNEWRNEFKYIGVSSKTPTIPRYVKATDEASIVSLYLFTLENYPSLGPYVRASLNTPIFKGESVTAESKEYKVKDSGTSLGSHQVFKLTDSLSPMTTKESIGFFWKVLQSPMSKIEARLGAGATQINGDGQLKLDDDKDTDSIEVSSIQNVSQAGIEFGAEWSGKWNEVSSYKVTVETLTPLTEAKDSSPCQECSDIERSNVELKASTSTKASDVLSIAYEYSALKQPDLVKEFQIRHGLKLVFEYDFLAK